MKLFNPDLTPEEQELSWYVDRKVILDDLSQRLKWESNVASHVIVFHGPGGIGKTSVRKMVENLLLKSFEVPYAVIDYEPDGSPRSAERTFMQIRRQLGRYGLKFTAFDLVWARYWEETTQQRISNANFPPELEDAVGVLAIIPVLGDAAQSIASLAKLSQSASQWLGERFGAANVTHLQQMNALELLKVMPEAIARDLEEMSEDGRNRGRRGDDRITVIFDGFERLEEHGIDDWFVRDFCQMSGSTLKVVFGRETLRWDRDQPLWQKYVIHHPALANLAVDDALEYLKKRGIEDQILCRHLVELTDGFPYHLRLAADLCQQIADSTGREPAIADFPEIERSSTIGETLLASILRQLDKSDYDAALLASIPRWFDQEIMELLVAEPASAPRLFQTLTRFSFCDVVPDRPGSHIMRKEARKFLRDRAKKLQGHWAGWNRKLMHYHSQRASDLVHLAEEIYHRFIVEPEPAFEQFHSVFYRALYSWRFGDCWILIQAVPSEAELPPEIFQLITLARIALLQEDWQSKERLDLANKLIRSLLERKPSPAVEGRAIRLAGLVNIKLGNRAEGLAEMEQAAAIFDSLGDSELKAGTLRDLGDLYYSIGDVANAIQYHQDAMSTLKNTTDAGKAHESRLEAGGRIIGLPLSNSLRAIASLYARTGRTHLAIKPLEEMLEEGRSDNNVRVQAEALSELGLAYRRAGRLAEAENAYRLAIPLFEELRAITSKAHVLCGLGMTVEQGGNVEAAQPYFQQSLRLFEEIGDTYGMAKIWHCMARFHHGSHNYKLAEDLYVRSLRIYQEIRHIANTGAVLVDLAKLKVDSGQNISAALELCQEAIAVFEGLEDRTAIANTYTNMGILNYMDGHPDLALISWQKAEKILLELLPENAGFPSPARPDLATLQMGLMESMWAKWLQMYEPGHLSQIVNSLHTAISALEGGKNDLSSGDQV